MFENKFGVGPNRGSSQSCFFLQFPQGGLFLGFARIEMPFGQIPAIAVPHEKELQSMAASKNQITAGEYTRESLAGF